MTNLQKNCNASDELDATFHSMSTKPNLKRDRLNLLLLILLYIMQGITFGFSISALPIILQSKKNSNLRRTGIHKTANSVFEFCIMRKLLIKNKNSCKVKNLNIFFCYSSPTKLCQTFQFEALFSYVLWPYSLRLLWAPIVDVHYVQWIGKRKSWLLPVQYLMGVFLFYAANNISDWIPKKGKPNILILTCVFFVLNLLASTQNIIVDSWALTMLKKTNVGYSSVCSSSGFAIGIMLGSVIPVLLTSEDFCNKHLRFTPGIGGIITIESFLLICGILFILVATLIGIFKKEKDIRLEDNYAQPRVTNSYKLLWDILKLPNIRILLIELLTMKINLESYIYCFYLLYTDNYIPKWSIKCTPIYYYLILGFLNAISEALSYIMLVSITAFFSRISDYRFGGTYITLLNTVSNFGMTYSSSIGLKLIDYLTFKMCSNHSENNCSTMDSKNMCVTNGGNCLITVDGYYVEIIICVIIGFIWYGMFKNVFKHFQTKSLSYWVVYVDQRSEENVKIAVDPCSK